MYTEDDWLETKREVEGHPMNATKPEVSHTPGPWRWQVARSPKMTELPILWGADGSKVCDFGSDERYPAGGCPPRPMDMSLIETAPNLLAVLRWYLLHYGNAGGAESVIAKAEGRDA